MFTPLLRRQRLLILTTAAVCIGASGLFAYDLPALPPMPTPPTPQAPGTVALGNPANFPEVKMDFPIESGPFSPTWASIESNYPTKDIAWLRQAKFGIWVHFGPQAAGQSGDWYARKLYIEGQTAYKNHIRDFGHPSTVGYKDLIRTWNPTALDPVALTNAYYNAGARFVLVQGVHHDQYDNWNSKYQPWNSMNLGAKRDILGEWKAAIRAKGMRFGVTFHHEYTWWWVQSAYRADTATTYGEQGVPYDGNLTTDPATALGTGGQWWAGMDLRMLYTINLREYIGIYNAMDETGYNLSQGIFVNHLEFAHWYATWWALRILDVIENYDPDFIYTDGNSTQPFSGNKSGSGYKCDAMQRVLAHYYNRTLERRGTLDTFGIVKFNPNPRGIVNTFEGGYPSAIKTDQPWIGESAIGDWFYGPGFSYDPGMVIRYLLECVSRDGAAAVCVALRPDGSLDPGSVTQLQAVGNWMTINNAGIYGSRAWVLYGEGPDKLPTGSLNSTQANATFTTADFRYTVGADGYLYAYCMKVPAAGAQLTLTALGTGDGNLAGPITSVSLLGSNSTLAWSQTATDLNITCPGSMPFQTAVCFKIGPPSIVRPPTPTDVYGHSTAGGVMLRWSSSLVSSTFTVKRATDPAGTFTTIATGIAGTSYTDTTVQAGNIYYYRVAATQSSTTSTDSAIAPGILAGSSSWQGQDVGTVGASGEFAKSGNRIVISGSGADIWGSADACYFTSRTLNGDGSITARITSQQNTGAWAKAGLMIRESTNANSRYVINFMSPSNGIALQQRTSTGGSASGVATAASLVPPYWLKLTRAGNTFTAARSPDGTTWTTVGTTTVTMASSVQVGLAACSTSDGNLMQAAFDQVSVTGQTSPEAPDSLAATAGDSKVDLTWPASSGAASYTVQRATNTGGPYTNVATGLTGTSYTDTTATDGTTYYYIVTATNSVGSSGSSAEANALPLDARQAWRKAHFGQIANSGNAADAADPDHDGRSNLLEYAMGSDPQQPDAAPSGVFGKSPDGQHLTLTFTGIADPALTYTVEAADSPNGPWTSIWTSTGASNVADSVRVTDPELISNHIGRVLRLKVTH
jgi:alpha-L-fucosidase